MGKYGEVSGVGNEGESGPRGVFLWAGFQSWGGELCPFFGWIIGWVGILICLVQDCG